MDRQKDNRFSPPAVGGISLLVVFAVLCLTVFALLSLITVQADVRLAEASVRAVSDYYAADVKAQEVLAQLRSGETPADVEITIHLEDSWHGAFLSRYEYTIPISDTQKLQVEVLVNEPDGSYSVLRWQALPAQEWESDDMLELWDGVMF